MLSQNFKRVADLKKTPCHADPLHGKNQEHVEKIIPERVLLFLSLLFEGMEQVSWDGEPVEIVMP